MKALRFIAVMLGLASPGLRGDIVMSLTPAVQYGAHGAEVVFSGTITNTGTVDKVFLNDISFTVSGASVTYLSPELNNFFANVPGILLPGESYTSGEIFRVVLGAAAPLGDYGGTIGLLGGTDINATGSLASSPFTIRETPTENWRLANFGDAMNTPAAADTADFDGDGVLNLMEFALNLDPKANDSAALPQPVISGGYLTYSFVPNAASTDLTYAVESSINLTTWDSVDVQDITPANPSPPGQRTFRYKNPIGPASPWVFLRLRVTRAP
jgi:hypothetical protein